MKVWSEPTIETLDINETAGGGDRNPHHDGQWITPDGVSWWEGTVVPSGR